MKKIYTAPVLDVVEFIVSDICTTSPGDQQTIGNGDDLSGDEIVIQAPRRNIIWTD